MIDGVLNMLIPCPFCAHDAALDSNTDDENNTVVYAHCLNCGASSARVKVGDGSRQYSQKERNRACDIARAIWNRRDYCMRYRFDY